MGIFELEELARRRNIGELTGAELVWTDGMPQWQPLDTVLGRTASGPLPPPIPKRKSRRGLFVGIVVGLFLAYLTGVGILTGVRVGREVARVRGIYHESTGDSVQALASRPVVWNSNTLTNPKLLVSQREFRNRQYLQGYKDRGERNPSYDATALGLISNWIAFHYGGKVDTNLPSLAELADTVAADPGCDPLALTISAVTTEDSRESVQRLERALKGYEHSRHRAYPQIYATVTLEGKLSRDREMARRYELDASAVRLLKSCFQDGSFVPEDQLEITEIMIGGWG